MLRVGTRNARYQQWESLLGNRAKRQRNREFLVQGVRPITLAGPPGLFNSVPAQRARLLLAQGDLAVAARWTTECGLSADDEPDYGREPGQLLLARVLIAQGLPGQALALLDRLYAAAVAQGRVGSVIEAGALRALALAASGEESGAVTALLRTERQRRPRRVEQAVRPGPSG